VFVPVSSRHITVHWCSANCSAEAETKAKLEKVAEIKRINAQIMAIKSEISKYEDTLKEYQLYKKFLFTVTPKVISVLVLLNLLKLPKCTLCYNFSSII